MCWHCKCLWCVKDVHKNVFNLNVIFLSFFLIFSDKIVKEANEGKKPKGSTKMRKRKGSMATFAAIDVGVRVSVEGTCNDKVFPHV